MATANCINNTSTPFTSGTTITATAGNVTITSGNLILPATTSTIGQVLVAGNNAIHMYGTDNIFLGPSAGNFTLTTGSSIQNVGFGTSSLHGLTTGASNTACGYESGKVITTGSLNTLYGYQAGVALTTGSDNCVIGESNLNVLTTGSYNSAFGYAAGQSLTTTDSSNMCWNATGTAGDNNTMRIGTAGTGAGQVNKCYIAGINGVTVTGTAVLCSTAGQLGTVASSMRFKENVKDMDDVSSAIYKLRPVTFNYKDYDGPFADKTKSPQVGLIAEEVYEVMPNLVVLDEKVPYSVKYHELPVLLLNELHKLQKRVEVLKEKLANKERA